jgi:N-acetylated-alpha-linked acidic dipeptidase
LNLSFGGFDEDGIYHSIYDDFYHFTKFSDPGFLYGRALAQFVGTATLRLADADILPYEFTGLADTVQTCVRELQALLKQRQDEAQERNRQVTDGVFAAVRDPKRPRPIPSLEEVPPALNFAPLENAASALTRRSRARPTAITKPWLLPARWLPPTPRICRRLICGSSRASGSSSMSKDCRDAAGTGISSTRRGTTQGTA